MRIVSKILAVSVAVGSLAAQASPDKMRPPATEAEEIAMALGALPESMRPTAAVHVLGPKGYRLARPGSSGVNCLVERSRPDTLEPICWDREGSETIMPVTLAETEWRAAGLVAADVERRVNEGYASGRFRAPRRSGLAYMLSTSNFVFTGEKVIHYGPHIMCYAPYLTDADIGGDGKDPDAPWILNAGSPRAYIIIPPHHGG